MDNDFQTSKAPDEQLEEKRQTRRQFFNGLGKWSLAVIAAVTTLRDGSHEAQSVIGSRFEAPSDERSNGPLQLARKKRPHGDQPHLDEMHFDSPGQPHRDYYRLEKGSGGSGGGTTSPDGTKRTFE